MTAEIAILNRSAVALASDSAVTIDTPTGPKIYETANKLFALIKGQPVGIMIYDSAEHLGVPWETIIKAYRMKRPHACFDTLEEYAADFLDFVTESPDLVPAIMSSKYLDDLVARRTRDVVDRCTQSVFQFFATSNRQLGQRRLRKFINSAIDEEAVAWEECDDAPWNDCFEADKFVRQRREQVDRQISRVLQQLPATISQRSRLRALVINSLTKTPFSSDGRPMDPRSGIVVAGFGEREYFPRLIPYDIFGAVDGVLRAVRNQRQEVEITVDNPSVIAPFAQREMVDGFMTGIVPQVQQGVMAFMNGATAQYQQATLDLLGRIGGSSVEASLPQISGPLSSLMSAMVRELEDRLRQLIETQVQPVLDSVNFLPKDELAAMAESLVNLTSLKRRVSIDHPQTVGGPVDVAVISRGDGFVWIKRKHYFNQDLNPAWVATHTY